jgi:hypothetical protein
MMIGGFKMPFLPAPTDVLLFVSFTSVLYFTLGKFMESFFRGTTAIDARKLIKVSEFLAIASILISIYVIYVRYVFLYS